MHRALQIRLAFAALVIGATSGSAQVASALRHSNVATVVRPSEAYNPSLAVRVEQQVSRLPPSAITTIVQPPPAPPGSGGGGKAEPTAGPPPAAEQPRLEYVEAPALEKQATSALAGQTDVKKVVGAQGAVFGLPGFLRQVDGAGNELQLKMIALAGKKLGFDRNLNSFVGTMWLGVNEITAGPSRELVTPVEFRVLNAQSAEPSAVRVTTTGASGYQEVRLGLVAAVDVPKVNIASNLVQDPFELSLPLNPTLIITSDGPIDGFGLATSTINVTALGVLQPKGKLITFQRTSGAGSLLAKKVALEEDGTATTELRSDGLGGATVSASLPGLVPAPTTIDFQFPYVTIFSSLIGGILGGLIRVGTSRMRGRRALLALGIAVLVGIFVFGLYAVGVNVLPIQPIVKAGAVLVFVVSGLGAFMGPSILPKGP